MSEFFYVGIIGQGFVGSAIREGLKHAFTLHTYDKKDDHQKPGWDYVTHAIQKQSDGEYLRAPAGSYDPLSPYAMIGICKVVFICLPTPMKPDGECDTSIVEGVIQKLYDVSTKWPKESPKAVVTIKSTVPPGFTERMNAKYGDQFVVCFNPEFLTERNPVEDFKNQDRIILGGPHEGTAVLKQLYETAYPHVPTTKTSSTIAELVKYTTNCFLATKVAFANEIKGVCDKLDIDYDKVIEYAIKDKRLGTSHWAVPGPDGKRGFGGSCFPKDLNGLIKVAEELETSANILKAAWQTNLEVRPEKDWEQLKGRAVSQ